MKRIRLLPNLITLGNYACGFLAISKAIDALAAGESLVFYQKMETAAWLVFLAMIFDALDGKVARLTGSASDLGAQLDSLADALTFGVAPAILAKVLLEHEASALGFAAHPRLIFLIAAVFAIMSVLRLARFNIENDQEASSHEEFKGLPSPAAAGSVVSAILLYISLREPRIETSEGSATLVGQGLAALELQESPLLPWFLLGLALLLVLCGFLMISRVTYPHMVSVLTRGKVRRRTLLVFVLGAGGLYLFPVPGIAALFNLYVVYGIYGWLRERVRSSRKAPQGEESGG